MQSTLFKHLVGAGEKSFRYSNAKCFSGPEVDVQIKLGGLLYWQFGRLRTFQYSVDIPCGAVEKIGVTWAITHKTSFFDKSLERIYGWQLMLAGETNDSFSLAKQNGIRQ